jgi:superfamily II DNA/RNA helicase
MSDDIKFFDSFDDMELKEVLLRGIYGYGFEKPSDIQSKCIVPIISGRDVIGQAKSGTGKTGAFGIAMLNLIDIEKKILQGMILVHTHELAIQIYNVLKELGTYMKGLNINLSIGGGNIKDNIENIKNSHITIGTVGRLYDLIVRRKVIELDDMKILVVDEADAVLVNKQTNLEQVKTIISNIPKKSQICIFSATLPKEVISLTKHFMNNPVCVLIEDKELSLDGIKQYYIDIEKETYKLDTLKDIYKKIMVSQCIIYVNTKEKGEFLYKTLTEENNMISLIHGNMDSENRAKIMNDFRIGKNRILLSTDLLARGIDVQQVNLIINYDLPFNNECYLHRIGRSGRFGRRGMVINFITNDDKINFKNIIKTYNINMIELQDENLEELNA